MPADLPAKRSCAFLDRDGVLNEDRHYVHDAAGFHWLPGVIEALQKLQTAGYALVVVTNQGGIGLGLYDEAAFEELTAHMRAELAVHGVTLDGVYHCPHHPRASSPALRAPCLCRKPAPGMLQQAATDLGLDMTRSFMVGDKSSDLAAARAAGVAQAYLVRSGKQLSRSDSQNADAIFNGLLDCANHALSKQALHRH
jgi:D-glycero-D-manno-heptose 1,7-bisphosphate phosphatase